MSIEYLDYKELRNKFTILDIANIIILDRSINSLPLTIYKNAIPQHDNVKYLGIYLDNKKLN